MPSSSFVDLLALLVAGIFVVATATLSGAWLNDQRVRAREGKMRKKRHRSFLVERFGESDADRILRGEVWCGATLEMMSESLGKPRTGLHRTSDPLGNAVFHFEGPDGVRPVEVTFRGGHVVSWRELDE
jgi:hypothetical protein